MWDGYKTYIVALLAGIYGAANLLGADPKYGALFLAIAGIAATLRKAIEDLAKK
jgi:hypothetical protein